MKLNNNCRRTPLAALLLPFMLLIGCSSASDDHSGHDHESGQESEDHHGDESGDDHAGHDHDGEGSK